MKSYESPVLIEEKVMIEDVIAASEVFGAFQPGDKEANWPFK